MKPFKKPDLNAPRHRPKKFNLTNKEVYNEFLNLYPKYKGTDYNVLKNIISKFNQSIWEEAISNRDGIELPEQLGFIFIGTCDPSEHLVEITNRNWESDQYLAKIFYTNYETKYRFKFHDLWCFSATRVFKRTVAKEYPKEWKKYIKVANVLKISRLFRKESTKMKLNEMDESNMKNYNEFNLEDPWQKILLEI